jgi:hypothetical protein
MVARLNRIPLTIATLALLSLAACANVTTMKIRQNRDGSISIDSGKDVKAERVEFRRGDEEVVVVGYSSMANTDAINAQANREVAVTQAISAAIVEGMKAGVAAAAKGAGVP